MKFSPEFKITLYVIFTAVTFLMKDMSFFAISGAAAACFFSLLPDKSIRTGIVPIFIFLFITFMSGMLFTGGRVIASFAGFDITHEGLTEAVVKTVRVFLMIVGAKVLMLTTSVDEMIAGLNRMLPVSNPAKGSAFRDFIEIAGLTFTAFPAIVLRLKTDFREKAAASHYEGLSARLIDTVRLSASLALPLLGEIIHCPERVFGELTRHNKENNA
ncbi:MAG: hypothetical protein HQK97_05385 [Nitrospirae bacterium]|nr:hypothetical protein [Nitrospirota bacterium]